MLKLSLLRLKLDYVPGKDVFIGFDCASSEFYDKGRQVADYTKFEGEGAYIAAAEQTTLKIGKQCNVTIEDDMDENDTGQIELLLNVLVVGFSGW